MNLGYDYIVIETNDIVSFLKETKKHQLTLFHLHQLDALRYSFYVPIYQRYITSSMHLPIQKSIGLLHYLFLIFKFPQIIFTLGGADNFLDQKEQGEEKHGIYGTRKRTSSRPI